MMRTERAFEIVLELARAGVIENEEVRQDEEFLRPMQLEQIEACDVVEDFFVNNVCE
jgi:hypothetical protein